ncbi:MAG: asparagine synthase C-terminal domain-containing protein [Gammaproteobacteria bacterium]|nr:asparagine synthase C-terminal domain-containing protein [Gammaproteobacteria bacterium]
MQAADRADRFRELLMDACRLRLRADVPVASSLSGGLDSASVAASIAAGPATRSRPCRQAYIAAFPGTDQDESSYGMIAAHSAGMVPVLREISVDAFRESIDTYLYQFEEIGGLFGAAAWMLYREMRRDGVIVSLEGHGGDELLGGYVLHVVLALMRSGGLLAAPRRVPGTDRRSAPDGRRVGPGLRNRHGFDRRGVATRPCPPGSDAAGQRTPRPGVR